MSWIVPSHSFFHRALTLTPVASWAQVLAALNVPAPAASGLVVVLDGYDDPPDAPAAGTAPPRGRRRPRQPQPEEAPPDQPPESRRRR